MKDEFGNNVANAPLFIIDGMQGGDFSDTLILNLSKC